jgi:ElaB/YqjD/DUF883 family membrane-anchored ribosome-binding protein
MAKTPSAEENADPGAETADKVARIGGAAATTERNEVAENVRAEVQTAIDALGGCVRELADYTHALAGDTRDQTREKLRRIADRTEAYVTKKPFQSMAFAAAAGALATLLLGRRR